MFFIGVPYGENLSSGVQTKVNGHPTVLFRKDRFLEYVDSDGMLNKCEIIEQKEEVSLSMPDGSTKLGTYYFCASSGQDPQECHIIRPTFV